MAHLRRRFRPASIREIAHGMGLKHQGRRFLPSVIQQLKQRGDIEEIPGGRYRLADTKHSAPRGGERESGARRCAASAGATSSPRPAAARPPASAAAKRSRDPNLIAGQLVAHRDGYGFRGPRQADTERRRRSFHRARQSGRTPCMAITCSRASSSRRADGRAEGRIVANSSSANILRSWASSATGRTGNVVLPYDTRILHEVTIPPGEELTPDLRAETACGCQAESPWPAGGVRVCRSSMAPW